MQSSLYVALSGQVALEKRLDTIANNVANASTPGFRAENVSFESIISQADGASVSFSGKGSETFARDAGQLSQTGNSLDIAVRGRDGYLAIATSNGTVYTRDGRMRISSTGDLETLTGNPILDIGGAPLQINPSRGPVTIAANGQITQQGKILGTIGLFRLAPDQKLQRAEGAGFIPELPAEPVVDFTENGIVQGFLEGANVNPVLEISRLIAVTRTFEQISSSIDKLDTTLSDAIRTLGSGR